MVVDKKKAFAYLASGGAVLGFAHAAEADVIFNAGNAAPGTVVSDTSFALDLDGDGTNDIVLNHDANGGFYGTQYAVASVSALGANFIGGSFYASAFQAGSSFPGAASLGVFGYMWDGAGFAGSQFNAGTTNYLGVQFDISGNTHFGFVEIFISDDPNPNGLATSNEIGILNYAYESNPNTPITFQAIPEPGSLGLLALGAVGVAAMRRRKRVA